MCTTPKVGDTINAKVEPATATGTLTYSWLLDGTPIDVPSAASLTVTADMVGKKISVKVTGDNESTATSAETAPVEAAATEKLQILSAAQKSGTEIEVKFNKAVSTTDYSFAVTRGTTAQTIETAISEDGLTANIILGTKMGEADYDITVTNKNDAEDTAKYTLSAKVATLDKLEFQGTNLIQTTADGKKASVGLRGYDQFGGEVVLTNSNLNLYSSVSTSVTFDADTKLVTVAVDNATLLAIGNVVTVTAMYNTGTTYVQVATPLTVAQRAFVKELSFGELDTTKTTLKGERVTLDNFATDTYYLPITSVKDQYDNALNAKQLNKMAGTSAEGNMLFLVPSATMTSYYAAVDEEPFDELADGSVILKLKHGTLEKPGTFQVSVTSVGGGAFNTDVTIEDNPFIETLNVVFDEVYRGKDTAVSLTATDQYGNAFDLYESFDKGVTGSNLDTIKLGDKNGLTSDGTSIKASKGAFTYTKNANTKTVKLTYKNVSTTDTTDTITITTAKPTVSTVTLTINDVGYVAGIKGLASTVKTNLTPGIEVDFGDLGTILFLDSYGAVVAKDATYRPAPQTLPYTQATAPTDYNSAWYSAEISGTDSTGSTDPNANGGVFVAGSTKGSVSVKVTLHPVSKKANSTDYEWASVVTKTVSFTITDLNDLKYSVEVDKNKTLHVGEKSALVTSPSVKIKLVAKDKSGSDVAVENVLTKVETDKGLSGVVSDGKEAVITYTGDTEVTGSGKMTVSATVAGVEDAVTCELNYDDAASVATGSAFEKYSSTTDAWTASTEEIAFNGLLYVTNSTKTNNAYRVYISDQYGDAMLNSYLVNVASGQYVGSSDTSFTDGSKLRLTNGTINQNVTLAPKAADDLSYKVNLDGVWVDGTPQASHEYTVSKAADLKEALAIASLDLGNDYTINVTGTVALSEDTTIGSNVTLNVKSGAVLGTTTAYDLINSGTLVNNGTINLGKGFTPGTNWTSNGAKWALSSATNGDNVTNLGAILAKDANADITITTATTVADTTTFAAGNKVAIDGNAKVDLAGTLTNNGSITIKNGELEVTSGKTLTNGTTGTIVNNDTMTFIGTFTNNNTSGGISGTGATWEFKNGTAGTNGGYFEKALSYDTTGTFKVTTAATLGNTDPVTVGANQKIAVDAVALTLGGANNDLTNNGEISIAASGTFSANGADVVNNNKIAFAASSTFTAGAGTFTGNGTYEVNDDTVFESLVTTTSTATIEIKTSDALTTATQTWTAPVKVAAGVTLTLAASETKTAKPVEVAATGKIVIPSAGTLTVLSGGTLTNAGDVEVNGASGPGNRGQLGIAGTLNNTGTITCKDYTVVGIDASTASLTGGKFKIDSSATTGGVTFNDVATTKTAVIQYNAATSGNFTSAAAPDGSKSGVGAFVTVALNGTTNITLLTTNN